MSLNESTFETAALEWFLLRQGYGGHVGALDYEVGDASHLPQSRTLPTLRDTLLPKLLSGELSLAGLESKLAGADSASATAQIRKPAP